MHLLFIELSFQLEDFAGYLPVLSERKELNIGFTGMEMKMWNSFLLPGKEISVGLAKVFYFKKLEKAEG